MKLIFKINISAQGGALKFLIHLDIIKINQISVFKIIYIIFLTVSTDVPRNLICARANQTPEGECMILCKVT